MTLPWDAVYGGQLAVYGTRGMPAIATRAAGLHRGHGLDLSPMIARRVGCPMPPPSLPLFDGPAPPGIAVITDFAA
jgi:hypothetical protein